MPTPQQYRKLRDALISAFPEKSRLEQMLYFELGRNLNEITRDSDLQDIAFKLIQTSESQGWLLDLVNAARKENSGNSELAAVAAELLEPRQRILILAANPTSVSPLRLDEKIREIEEGLRRAKNRERFILVHRWAVRPRDIQRAMLEINPSIIHFYGHGTGDEGLVLEDETGEAKLVYGKALAGLFSLFADQIDCAVLDGCYSERQAKAISEHIPYVVGISQAIGDRAAIEFTIGFYDALAAGRPVELAYRFASSVIKLSGLPETLTPVLITRNGVNLQQYDQALKQYEEEFSKAVQQEYPLSPKTRRRLKSLCSVWGIRDEDLKAIETRIEDIKEIRLAVNNQSIQNCQRLAEAIVRCMGATCLAAITSPHFSNGSLWEIALPETGLQIPTQIAVFYLSQQTQSTLYSHLKEITEQRDGAFLMFVSVSDCCPHGLTPLQVIRFNALSLMEMISTPENELLWWLARFLFGQINVVALPGMLPYKASGIAKLFFGREHELARITSGDQRGGIIIGAHRSGKTSFLEKLKEKLQQRACKVIGPLTFFEFQSFFKDTLKLLGKDCSMEISLEDWSSALKAYSKNKRKSRLVFLFDEVDRMIQKDIESGSNLGQKMRALQNEGYCEFFLAGHAKLREAITIEGGPFRNFAEEITFTGLTKEAAIDLIQKPMKLLGFEVSNAQANRIYAGTDGVAVLIQEFCLKLLDELRQSGVSEISDTTIEEVEQSPDFLDIVFEHYKYGQTWDSMAITLLSAMKGEVQRKDITIVFKEHGIVLSTDQLDKALDFLKRFGVLQKLKNGYFRVLSGYLTDAIKTNDPDSRLESELGKGRTD